MRWMTALILLSLAPLGARGEFRVLGNHGFRVGAAFHRAVLSPDGRTFALSGGGRLYLLDARSGTILQAIDCSGTVDLAFAGLDRLRALSHDGSVRLIDLRSGRCLSTVTPEEVDPPAVFPGRFLAGGEVLWRGCNRRQPPHGAQLHDVHSGRCWQLPPRDRPCELLVSTGGRFLAELNVGGANLDEDRMTRFWVTDVHQARAVCQGNLWPEVPVRGWFASDRLLLLATKDRLHRLDLPGGTVRPLDLERRPGAEVHTVAVSAREDRLAVLWPGVGFTARVRVWDLATGRVVQDEDAGMTDALAFQADGSLLGWNSRGAVLQPRVIGQPCRRGCRRTRQPCSPWPSPTTRR